MAAGDEKNVVECVCDGRRVVISTFSKKCCEGYMYQICKLLGFLTKSLCSNHDVGF